MPRGRWVLAVLFAGVATPALAQSRVDFEGDRVEGERALPGVGRLIARPRPVFRCDASQLSLEAYNACYEASLSELCGTQLIERDRFELEPLGRTLARSAHSRTVASAYPYSLHLDRGGVYSQQASAHDVWTDPVQVLGNQSPALSAVSGFAPSRGGFLLADPAGRRVFVVSRTAFGSDDQRGFQKVELGGRNMSLVGVLAGGRLIVATSRELLLMRVDGSSGRRLPVPLDDYQLDPSVDRFGNLLLVSRRPEGQVYLLSAKGALRGAFPRKPGHEYHLLPTGLVASAELATGNIALLTRTGVVVSRSRLDRPLSQFGVLRHKKGADLFFVASDGVGVLYADGFEKSFLARKTQGLRVVEAARGVLGLVVSSPSRDDERVWVERTVEYYALGRARSRVARVVEGVCPMAVKLAERALRLAPSRKSRLVDGRLRRYR